MVSYTGSWPLRKHSVHIVFCLKHNIDSVRKHSVHVVFCLKHNIDSDKEHCDPSEGLDLGLLNAVQVLRLKLCLPSILCSSGSVGKNT